MQLLREAGRGFFISSFLLFISPILTSARAAHFTPPHKTRRRSSSAVAEGLRGSGHREERQGEGKKNVKRKGEHTESQPENEWEGEREELKKRWWRWCVCGGGRRWGGESRWQPHKSSRVERAERWSQLIPSTCFETKSPVHLTLEWAGGRQRWL